MGERVRTAQGVLEGSTEGGVHRFYGIPYAAPPVGPLRWRPPADPARWEGVRSARDFGPACIQTIGGQPSVGDNRSEDCLYLNVWTATLEPDARQPVMVWIHGGGNLGGAGHEDWCDGSHLASKEVTVVTFNYRLGAFGFLAHPSLGANFGVLDYVACLRWVRDNIAGFGGDPDCVTIFGNSAGAVAVRTLLSCPQARGLFHRGIIQSAGFEDPAYVPGWSYARAEAAAEQLFDRLGSRDPEALRKAPSEAVGAASHEFCAIFPPPDYVHTPANLVWMPVPDEAVVFADGFPGWPEDVPVMLGTLENEARYFIKPDGVYRPSTLENMIGVLCEPRHAEIAALFAATDEIPYESLDRLFTTAIWTEPALATYRRFAALGNRRFYVYHMTRAAPGAVANGDLVKHSAEIRYVFGTLTDDGWYDDADRRISDAMQDAWIAFARDGVPSGPHGDWPAFDAAAPMMTLIAEDIAPAPYRPDALIELVNAARTD